MIATIHISKQNSREDFKYQYVCYFPSRKWENIVHVSKNLFRFCATPHIYIYRWRWIREVEVGLQCFSKKAQYHISNLRKKLKSKESRTWADLPVLNCYLHVRSWLHTCPRYSARNDEQNATYLKFIIRLGLLMIHIDQLVKKM